MKKLTIAFCFLSICGSPLTKAAAQSDSVSIYLLKRMEANISGLKSFSVQVTNTYDINTEDLGLVKYSESARVRVLRPDKMTVERRGDNGRQFVVYDGKQVQVYNRDRNTYAKLAYKGTVIDMIDALSRNYGIDFPAADILYPDFVSDVQASVTRLSYLGITQIDGRDCFHIAAVTPERNWQIWIRDDAENLPMRLLIVYTQNDGSPQFQSDFREWRLNENENQAVFEFTPVNGVWEVPLQSSSANK